MSYKFFYIYLVGGTICLGLFIYQLTHVSADFRTFSILLEIIPAIYLYYLAYKVRREKQDKDMM
jgi:threonine/homoserine/homoserine lactone efflux protein